MFVSSLHQLRPGLRKWLAHPVFLEREAMGSFPVLGVREGSGVACSTRINVNMLALSLAGHSQRGTQCPASVDKRQQVSDNSSSVSPSRVLRPMPKGRKQ